jgi:hypothetical protein
MRKKAKKEMFTFPLLFEATHVDTGYKNYVRQGSDSLYNIGGKTELVMANSMAEMRDELLCMDFLYGDMWIFVPVPLDAV